MFCHHPNKSFLSESDNSKERQVKRSVSTGGEENIESAECRLSAVNMMWTIVVYVLGLGRVAPSAIPMWELLTRTEKMNHLFNMFTKEVAEHCGSRTISDCNKVMLVYGLTNLAKMEDESLNKMDPYQRGAHDIIWESMMKGSYKATGKGTGDHRKETRENWLGSQEEASSNIEQYSSTGSHFVHGPMVVRVLLNGEPVAEDLLKPLPKDEDAEEYILMRSKSMPTMEELLNTQKNCNIPSELSVKHTSAASTKFS